MIALRGVTRRFGHHVVLDEIDLELAEGAVTALTGPNGSGKTTLGRLLLGLDLPDVGTIDGLAGRRRAAVFQEDRLCAQLTAVANVRLVLPRATPPSAVVAELDRVGLSGDALAQPVRDLSGGQRRRVVLARALMPDADLVVLDEPFTGLDADAKPLALAYARERLAGRTALLITHDPTEAMWFGARVVMLATEGRSGAPDPKASAPAQGAQPGP